MIERRRAIRRLQRLLRDFPSVGILGARQVGKSTLARQVSELHRGPVHWFDLEKEADRRRLADPGLALEELRGLVVLDEIQLRPDLFPALRVLIDRPKRPARFLILGSASPELLRQGSESLAGRIVYERLTGFDLEEVGPEKLNNLWLRGGFPRSFLARSHATSFLWRSEFIEGFLHRDLGDLGFRVSATTMRRFWAMLAHYHGQTWNSSEFARSFGVADTTVRHYLDLLASTFLVRILAPWTENLKKRQVKSPKIYLSDSGLLHTLLGLETLRDLESHPRLGASWEGFAMEATIRHLEARPSECFFWATHTGAELDLLIVRGRRRWGFEFKRSSAPEFTKSMRIALEDLHLDRLFVIHAGKDRFPLSRTVEAVPLVQLLEAVPALVVRRKR